MCLRKPSNTPKHRGCNQAIKGLCGLGQVTAVHFPVWNWSVRPLIFKGPFCPDPSVTSAGDPTVLHNNRMEVGLLSHQWFPLRHCVSCLWSCLLNSVSRINLCLDPAFHDLIITKIAPLIKGTSWPQIKSEYHVELLTFHGLGKGGSERLSCLPVITQQVLAVSLQTQVFSNPQTFLHSHWENSVYLLLKSDIPFMKRLTFRRAQRREWIYDSWHLRFLDTWENSMKPVGWGWVGEESIPVQRTSLKLEAILNIVPLKLLIIKVPNIYCHIPCLSTTVIPWNRPYFAKFSQLQEVDPCCYLHLANKVAEVWSGQGLAYSGRLVSVGVDVFLNLIPLLHFSSCSAPPPFDLFHVFIFCVLLPILLDFRVITVRD